jgi:8-oxo-dGTP pyrophosphatase MutT (NUDIX family)
MLYLEKPEKFIPKFDVVSCFVEYNNRFLLLHRQNHKPQGNTWGVPAGKVEQGESHLHALVREIKEEIGLEVYPEKLLFKNRTFVKFSDYDFVYDIYILRLSHEPEIRLDNRDHKDFIWTTPEEALKMNLIQDEDACIRLCYSLFN